MTDQSPRLVRLDPQDELFDAWQTSVGTVFKDRAVNPPDALAALRKLYKGSRLQAALVPNDPVVGDGDQVVATFESFDVGLTVPGGGCLQAWAVSAVTVLPTHRRRGLLSELMHRDLDDAVATGATVAILIASEGSIYGRFGFGPATSCATWSVEPRRARLRPEVARLADDGRCAVVPVSAARTVLPQVYERARRAGAIDRQDFRWDITCGQMSLPGREWTAPFTVLHRDEQGEPDGYLLYRVDQRDAGGANRRVRFARIEIQDLQAATDQAYRALWRHLLALDLVDQVVWPDAGSDEALPWLLTDPRAVRCVTRDDFLWTRVLDPVAVLTARQYEGGPGELTFEVTDPDGWAAGRYSLQVTADGAGAVHRVDSPPDLTLAVDVLSALWLGADGAGGSGLAGAITAGRAVEHRAGAAARFGALLRTSRAPRSTTWF